MKDGYFKGRQVSLLGTPGILIASFTENSFLTGKLVRNDVLQRYKNTFMGLFWTLLTPVLSLLIYSFVFSVIFKVRFPNIGTTGEFPYGIVLFCGLILHQFIADTLNSSPTLVLGNPNFVKRVVFPLEVLSLRLILVNLFHFAISFVVLLAVILYLKQSLPLTVLWLPFVWAPYFVLCLGIALFLSSFGVYVRDVNQFMGLLSTMLMFGSTILFPIDSLPPNIQQLILLNPLTFIVDQTRAVLLWGLLPDFQGWLKFTGISLLVFWFGGYWFVRTRRGFADVV